MIMLCNPALQISSILLLLQRVKNIGKQRSESNGEQGPPLRSEYFNRFSLSSDSIDSDSDDRESYLRRKAFSPDTNAGVGEDHSSSRFGFGTAVESPYMYENEPEHYDGRDAFDNLNSEHKIPFPSHDFDEAFRSTKP